MKPKQKSVHILRHVLYPGDGKSYVILSSSKAQATLPGLYQELSKAMPTIPFLFRMT